MTRSEVMLAAMSSARTRPFLPVQIQKLFFILDQNLPEQIGGPLFKYKPHDYGPFDKSVYRDLEELASEGFVEITYSNNEGLTTYRLTPEGYDKGEGVLAILPAKAQNHISEIVEWLLSHSFSQIVSAIYSRYPEMAVNSVFVKEQA